MAERLERLSLVDLTNLEVEAPDTPMHQGALGVIDGAALLDDGGRVRIEALRNHLAARLDRVPQLRRKLHRTAPLEGRPLWVDDPSFRIEDHVLVERLRAPGGERAAMDFAEARMSALMDRRHPMWTLWFLEGYGEGRVGIFLKLHHALADGRAILNIIGLLFDLEPGAVDATPASWSPVPAPGHVALIRDNAARKLEALGRAMRRLAHPVALAQSAAAGCRAIWASISAGTGTPKTSLNRPIGLARRVGVIRFRLAEVKAAAHARGVKVNDIILEVIAASLGEVMAGRGERTGGVSISASMAVLESSTGGSALVGNHAGTMIVRLPVGPIGAEPRITAVANETARAKRSQVGVVSQGLMVLLAVSGLTRFFIRRQRIVNILATNLAGPPFPLYVAGARLLDAFPITPIAGNVTASFAALSYDGMLDLSVHADGDAWPDFDLLMAAMGRSWSELTLAEAA